MTAKPTVWYIAAGYKLPAGVEAYLLHYATELRRHGFDTRIFVFEPLPRHRHRYLEALDERGIPIASLYSMCAARALAETALLFGPWFLYTLFARRRWPRVSGLHRWVRKRLAVLRLDRLIVAHKPDLVHVKARVISEAWAIFPPKGPSTSMP